MLISHHATEGVDCMSVLSIFSKNHNLSKYHSSFSLSRARFDIQSSQSRYTKQSGFTLLELMLVVAILGLLSTFAMASYDSYITRSKLTEMANQLGHFAREFEIWKQVHGRYPNDSHIALPPDAPQLNINEAQWLAITALGGTWNWEGPDRHDFAGISIMGPTASEEHLRQFDAIIDDGNLSTGKFRRLKAGRVTYILEE